MKHLLEQEKRTADEGIHFAASAKVQLILFTIFILFMAWILYVPTVEFRTKDEAPELISLTPQKIIDLGGAPTTVHVGMYLRDVPKFDLLNGQVMADLTVWFSFDPQIISLERIGKFDFDRSTILFKSVPYTRIQGNRLLAKYDMRIMFNAKLNFTDFPLDDHRVSFILTNYFLSPTEVIFEASRDTLVFNPEIQTPGWLYVGKGVITGYLQDILSSRATTQKVLFSRVVFYLDFARSGFRHNVAIIIPLLLIFIISLLTFTFNPYGSYSSNIIPISVSAITAVIAHHFVIDRMSPETGYFMLSNHIFLLILVFCSIILMVNIFGKRLTGVFKDIVGILLYLSLMVAFFVLVNPFG